MWATRHRLLLAAFYFGVYLSVANTPGAPYLDFEMWDAA